MRGQVTAGSSGGCSVLSEGVACGSVAVCCSGRMSIPRDLSNRCSAASIQPKKEAK